MSERERRGGRENVLQKGWKRDFKTRENLCEWELQTSKKQEGDWKGRNSESIEKDWSENALYFASSLWLTHFQCLLVQSLTFLFYFCNLKKQFCITLLRLNYSLILFISLLLLPSILLQLYCFSFIWSLLLVFV